RLCESSLKKRDEHERYWGRYTSDTFSLGCWTLFGGSCDCAKAKSGVSQKWRCGEHIGSGVNEDKPAQAPRCRSRVCSRVGARLRSTRVDREFDQSEKRAEGLEWPLRISGSYTFAESRARSGT